MTKRYLLLTLALAVALAGCADAKPVKTCLEGQDGCKTCRRNKCVACEDGMGLKNGRTCVMCTAGSDCLSCQGNKPGKCTICAAGMYADAKGACKACKTENCANCLTRSGACKACVTGMALKGNKCVKCDGAGQVIVRGRCQRCPRRCDACASTARCNPDGCEANTTFVPRSGKCAPVPPTETDSSK